MLLFENVLTAHPRKFEQHTVDDILGEDLRFEPELTIDVIIAFLLLIKYLTAAANHNIPG